MFFLLLSALETPGIAVIVLHFSNYLLTHKV